MSTPTKFEIELNFDDYLRRRHVGFCEDESEITEPQTVEGIILDAVAEKMLLRAVDHSKDDHYRGLAGRVRDILNSEIESRVQPLVEEALNQPMLKTNVYGEPTTGTQTTLREEIVRIARAHLTSKNNDSYHNPGKTVVEAFIASEVKKVVDNELKEALAQAKAEVSAAVKDHAADLLAQAMRK